MDLKNRSHKLVWWIFLFMCLFLINTKTTVHARVELGGSGNDDTSKEIVLPKITGLKADTITTDSITVAWTPDTEHHAIQVAISDKSNIAPEFPTEQKWFTPNDFDNPHYKFENLTADTTYYIRIRYVKIESAYPRVGLDIFFGDPSDILKVKTLSESTGAESTNTKASSTTNTIKTSAGTFTVKNGSATLKNPKSKTLTKLTIPATIKANGKAVPVTAIAKNAFKGMDKLTTVTIGKNVKTIGAKAFYGCKKLKKITIKSTKLTKKTIGSKAFTGINKKAVIKSPKAKKTAYKKILLKKGMKKTMSFK